MTGGHKSSLGIDCMVEKACDDCFKMQLREHLASLVHQCTTLDLRVMPLNLELGHITNNISIILDHEVFLRAKAKTRFCGYFYQSYDTMDTFSVSPDFFVFLFFPPPASNFYFRFTLIFILTSIGIFSSRFISVFFFFCLQGILVSSAPRSTAFQRESFLNIQKVIKNQLFCLYLSAKKSAMVINSPQIAML
ncbi:unnamed protein product [Nyctereutes procyonoides]|uniref:(raccoon dog) hypothetical protein n=1 Tax=Nyctereutes procyonoides TaxID=34880 RepID=A0A811YBK9_NYCPR|nr:unnamed protein product [Nyctereutes procyonoides]